MAASKPGNTDRGWNDPPVFDYQGAGMAVAGSSQHTKLNKRVAYPMSSNSSVPAGTATLLNPSDGPPRLPPVHILPPSTTTTTPTPVPLLIPSLSPTTDPCGDSVLQPAIFSPTAATVPGTARPVGGAQTEVKVKDLPSLLAELSLQTENSLLDYVKAGLTSAAESVKETLQGRAMEDVVKKVGLMGECWTAGTISPSAKSQLGSLVAALNKQQVEEAHEIHLALMINHTAEVNQWLVAVKRIIQELRSKAAGSQVSQGEGQTQPLVLDPCLTLQTDSQQTSSPVETTDSQASPSAKETETSEDTNTDKPAGEGS